MIVTISNATGITKDGRLLALLLRSLWTKRSLVNEFVLAIGGRRIVAVLRRLLRIDVLPLRGEAQAITTNAHPRALLRYFGQSGGGSRKTTPCNGKEKKKKKIINLIEKSLIDELIRK